MSINEHSEKLVHAQLINQTVSIQKEKNQVGEKAITRKKIKNQKSEDR